MDEIKHLFPNENIPDFQSSTDVVDQLKHMYMFLKVAIFAGEATNIDTLSSVSDWDGDHEADSMSDISELRLIADISLLLDLKRKLLDHDELERRILGALEAKQPFIPGPVGESPVHTCFLLGLKDLGKRVVERFYGTPELLSEGYASDLAPWIRSDRVSGWEDGLYTGQTCLHIAIVQEDVDLVEFLLDRRISTVSRASGRFFQPRWMRLPIRGLNVARALWERWKVLEGDGRSGAPRASLPQSLRLRFEGGEDQNFSVWQLLQAWLWTLVAVGDPSVTVLCLVNDESRCYYGEFPLSFAASVGCVRACSLLYTYHRMRLDGDGWLTAEEAAERDRQLRLRAAWGGWAEQVPTDMSLFVNAMDGFGNTAMHMAVR